MKDKPIVLMTHSLPDDWVGNLLDDYQVIVGQDDIRGIDSSMMSYLENAAAIFCLLDDPIPAEVLENAPNLKVVSTMAVGLDNIDVQTCTRLGIPVGHTPGILTEGTADLTIALLLAVGRQILSASDDARRGRWNNWDPTGWLGVDLHGATAGIVGMGKIGSAVARRLAAFGARIIFTNRSKLPKMEKQLKADQVHLNILLKTSDIICLHVPLNEDTHHLINEQAFQNMKSTAILINAARGAVVDTPALVRALKIGQIRAAGLDVTDPEPLPPDHPLYGLKNCLITPHIGSATFNTRKRMAEIAIQNIDAGIKAETLPFCANPGVYR